MRKTLTVLLAAVTLGASAANAATAFAQTGATASTKKKVVTRKVKGQSFEADRWGTVTVVVTIRTTTTAGSKKTTVTLHRPRRQRTRTTPTARNTSCPSRCRTSARSSCRRRSANVQTVSGATYTSQAFVQSLQSALAKV